jgi:hypothetical protein
VGAEADKIVGTGADKRVCRVTEQALGSIFADYMGDIPHEVYRRSLYIKIYPA